MRQRVVAIGLLAVLVGVASFFIARTTSTTGSKDREAGLTDEQRMDSYATAIAETATRVTDDGMRFAASGLSVDDLPRVNSESSGRLSTTDPETAARESSAVLRVESLGGYVDPTDARVYVRIKVVELMKGDVAAITAIRMAGGVQTADDGSWLLHLSPLELYLAAGETAILFLEKSEQGDLRQRAYEAIALKDGRVQARDGFAFAETLKDATEGDVLARLRGAARGR